MNFDCVLIQHLRVTRLEQPARLERPWGRRTAARVRGGRRLAVSGRHSAAGARRLLARLGAGFASHAHMLITILCVYDEFPLLN